MSRVFDAGSQRVNPSSLQSFLPPVAVFADPLSNSWEVCDETIDVSDLVSAARRIEGFVGAERRQEAAWTLHQAAQGNAASLRSRLGRPPDEPEAGSPVQLYFRIRTAPHPADWLLWNILRVVSDAAEDLIDAPLSGSDFERIGKAISIVVRQVVTSNSPTNNVSQHSSVERPSPEALGNEGMWLRRWLVGHQLHAMFNVHAALSLRLALASLHTGRYNAAVSRIDDAAQLVGAFAGARAQALALPPGFYEGVLRPSMLPPLTEVPLTGAMHLEYRAYRRYLLMLTQCLPQSAAELSGVHPQLALARERLLEADLIDAERHVTAVEPLVGQSRSLVQTTRSTENAVSSLRRIRHRRAAAVAPYVSFPDRLVSRCTDNPADYPDPMG